MRQLEEERKRMMQERREKELAQIEEEQRNRQRALEEEKQLWSNLEGGITMNKTGDAIQFSFTSKLPNGIMKQGMYETCTYL